MPGEITVLLQQWRENPEGHSAAAAYAELTPLVYDHLRQVARAYVGREFGGNELNATGLVHELFLRLMEVKSVEWEDRVHFYAFSARMMRNILVDEARRRSAAKRAGGPGGAAERIPLAGDLGWVDATSEQMLDLEQALQELSREMPEAAAAVELRIFLGCTSEEAAGLLGISKATVDRHMRFARAWLFDRLQGNR